MYQVKLLDSSRSSYCLEVERARIVEVARVFGWLGVTAFGGPAAHVALMRSELVDRRAWVDEETFLDLVGVTALLPGPNSTELAIELGRRRAGTAGLVAAGMAFITPAALMVGALAWAYTRHGNAERIGDLRYGILPVVVAIVAHASCKLGRTALRTVVTGLVGVAATIAFLAGCNELVILAVGAAATGLWSNRHRLAGGTPLLLPWVYSSVPTAAAANDAGLARIFWSFLKIGALLFGSGYVLVAFMQAEFVDRLALITSEQLLDAVAIGQVTPGPLFTTATFVGYLLHGVTGAVVATVAIFLPAFVLVALLGRFIGPLLKRPAARPILDGLNAAAVGLIAGVAFDLADQALPDPLTAAVAAVSLGALLLTKLNPTWLVGGGVLLGLAHASL
jgi:chromate transporter